MRMYSLIILLFVLITPSFASGFSVNPADAVNLGNECALVLENAESLDKKEIEAIVNDFAKANPSCLTGEMADQCSLTVSIEVTVGPISVSGDLTVTGDCEGFGTRAAKAIADVVSDLTCAATSMCEAQ